MEENKITDLASALNENGFAIKSGKVDGYQIDTNTKELIGETSTFLVPGFGIPPSFVLEKPPEPKEGHCIVYKDGAWQYDKAMYDSRYVDRNTKRVNEVYDTVNDLIVKLERKRYIKIITPEEEVQLKKLITYLLSLDELDLTDPDLVIPEME